MNNDVLLVKIEGPVWYTIYHQLRVVIRALLNPSINQPANGKRTSMGMNRISPDETHYESGSSKLVAS